MYQRLGSRQHVLGLAPHGRPGPIVRVGRSSAWYGVILIEQELSGGEFDHVHLALIGRFITPRTRITSCNRQVDNAWKQADSGLTSTDDGGPIK